MSQPRRQFAVESTFSASPWGLEFSVVDTQAPPYEKKVVAQFLDKHMAYKHCAHLNKGGK